MIKMAVFDLDNTLLRDDKTISDFTVSVLDECRKKGIVTAYATARSKQASSGMLARYTPDVFIGYGGALALSGAGGEAIHRSDIPAGVAYELINSSLCAPGVISVLAVNESVAYTSYILDPDASDTSHYRYYDFSVRNDMGYLKITLAATEPDVVERIASKYPMCDMLRYSGEDLYRFANRDATKWNAVKAVAGQFGISTNMIAAFGDDLIDMEMITRCGYGVAVENAVEELKGAAGFICDTNENDGVARWLEKALQSI